MAFGAQPSSTPGVRQSTVSLPKGNGRTWNVAVPGKDLTGFTGEWILGIPERPELLGAFLNQPYAAPQTSVLKSTAADLNIIVTGSGASLVSNLRFTLFPADTILLPPRMYWQEAVTTDPSTGLPVTVADGPVMILPSLYALRYCSPDPLPLWTIAPINFGIWQGTNAPAKVWGFGNPPNLPDFTGSQFGLEVQGLAGGDFSARTDDGTGAFTLDVPTATTTWNYTTAQSAATPTSGASYRIWRYIGTAVELWAHGQVFGLVA